MTPNLKTKNIVIRKLQLSDLKGFADYRALPSVSKYQSWSDYTYDDAVALFESTDYSKFGLESNWFQLAIVAINSDKLIGDLAVHFIHDKQVEIGFTIDPEFQEKGLGYEALCSILDYIFLELKKHRVIAVTDTQNVSSCRLLEKTGFRKEAHYVENIFFKGSWGDEYLYAMLHSEYQKTSD